MKKFLMCIPVLILLVAACDQKAAPVAESSSSKETAKAGDMEELTLEQVYKKTVEVSDKLKSLSMVSELNQSIDLNDQSQQLMIQSDISMDIMKEPFSLYQKMNMTFDGQPPQDTESYLTDAGFFQFDPLTQNWMKLPETMSSELLRLQNSQADPSADLKIMQQYINDIAFESDDSSYILTFQASGEKFQDFLQEQLDNTLSPELAENIQLGEKMDIKSITYVYHIDKETFYPTKLINEMEIVTEEQNEKITINQKSNSTFSNFDGVETIVVPEDIIESAEEMTITE